MDALSRYESVNKQKNVSVPAPQRPLVVGGRHGTHPAGGGEVLHPHQVSLELRQLLEVLQTDQAALELRRDLRHLLQRLCSQ